MRKLAIFLAAVTALAGLLAGCMGPPVSISAALDTPFTLAVGETAVIAGEGLELKFEDVIEDSRCPRDVVCIWEGQASYTLQLTWEGSIYDMILTEAGLGGVGRGTFGDYEITASLSPYPESTVKISPGDYRLQLTVVKP